jgi:hypothetical protein
MYNVAKTKQEFWTAFGLYMSPVLSSEKNKINWINYKTGIRQIYFKMDAGNGFASIGIELRQADRDLQQKYFDQLLKARNLLERIQEEEWAWQAQITDQYSNLYCRISREMSGVNIFDHNDWPAIIYFLKSRIIGLDKFWEQVKDGLG